MSLYDVVPEGLFSVLASKNKGLYCSALFVVFEAFKTHLKISKDELSRMIESQLESEINSAEFDEDDGISENEKGLSGKAFFLIRKLKESGWIIVEYEDDLKEYVTVPNFSSKIIKTLLDITNTTQNDNIAYVYSTYSSLKDADENNNPFEMITALNNAEKCTNQLIESLTSVFHDIKYYNRRLVDEMSVNQVTREHFNTYQQKVVEPILYPLKVRDSVPRYKLPIMGILHKWLAYDDPINSMTEYIIHNNGGEVSEIDAMLREKIHFIISTYEALEDDYITPIDERSRSYTRSTAQKIDYLINADSSVKGTLVNLLRSLSDSVITDNSLEKAQVLFEIYKQEYLGEESLYQRKRGKPRERSSELIMTGDNAGFEEKARAVAKRIMDKRFGKERVDRFVMDILKDNDSAVLDEFAVTNDESYVMTLLSVINAKRKDSVYTVEITDEIISAGRYEIPKIKYGRKIK